MRLTAFFAGFACIALSSATPVTQENLGTTQQPSNIQENEISFDQQGNEGISEVTTEQSLNDGGLEVGQEWDNVFEKFKYPTEPEESGNDVSQLPLDDAIPSDFDILKTDLKLTRSPNSEMEYYVGRAQCECGRPGERSYPLRIVNGTVVRINDYPWTVALIRKRFFGAPRGAYCGGTLINNRYILTASHCVDGMDAKQIEIWVHEEDFATPAETDGGTQRFQVEKIIMHPYYNRRTIDNDIALIKLADPVILDGVIVPACLPANNDYLFDGIEATVAGWGATEEGGSTSSTLMKVEVPIISNGDCNTKTNYKGKITENMLCAGLVDEGGKDSCQGDSGGPLTIENGGRRTQVGVVSWGYGCARPQSPGVYTRVGRYTQWIVANSKGADWCSI